jgi:hypothetical protein
MIEARIQRLVATLRVGLGVFLTTLLFSVGVSAAPPERTDVFDLESLIAGEFVDVGDAMLIRTPNSLNVTIWTTGLQPSDVYTVWWVIDAPPPGELPGESFCVMWATGHPIGPNGIATFSAHLKEGVPWEEVEPSPANGGAGPCPGLVDAETQDVFVVTRRHGPIIPGSVEIQMQTYLGGCDTQICLDDQIAFFAPVDP